MATFEEAGIKWLSSGSVANFSANPAYWVARYLIGGDGQKIAVAVSRHSAVHAGVRWYLHGSDQGKCEDIALREYMLNIGDREIGTDVLREQDAILPMLNEAFKLFDEVEARPGDFLNKVFDTLWLDGISTPFVCKPDYVYNDRVFNLKTTHRMPSKPPLKDVQDAALAALKYRRPVLIGYVTMKKRIWHAPTAEEMTVALQELVADAFAIQTLLERIDSPQQALAMLPLNRNHYLWSPDLLQVAASTLPQLPKTEMPHGLSYARREEVRADPAGDASGDLLPDRGPGHSAGDHQG